MQSGLGISSATGFLATAGEWLYSSTDGTQPQDRVADLALFALDGTQATKLRGKSFLRLSDCCFDVELGPAYLLMLGYPRLKSAGSLRVDQKVTLAPTLYGAFVYDGDTSGLPNYEPQIHVLIDGADDHLRDGDGKRMSIRGAHNVRVSVTSAFPGMSGCGVWRVGNPQSPPSCWQPGDARLVGIQTSVYEQSAVIKATRCVALTTFIHSAFPELRSAIELHAAGL
jgi:hypothetical protein